MDKMNWSIRILFGAFSLFFLTAGVFNLVYPKIVYKYLINEQTRFKFLKYWSLGNLDIKLWDFYIKSEYFFMYLRFTGIFLILFSLVFLYVTFFCR